MAHKRFIHELVMTIVVMTIVVIPTTVFAKMDGIVLKDNSGKLYNFTYEKLKTSLLDEGSLYGKFQLLKNQGAKAYSYHDDIQEGYILRTDLIDAFLNSTDRNFNAQIATETLKTTEMPSVIYNQVENPDGTISEIPVDENDFDLIDIY